jgi:hypothetical protein
MGQNVRATAQPIRPAPATKAARSAMWSEYASISARRSSHRDVRRTRIVDRILQRTLACHRDSSANAIGFVLLHRILAGSGQW